MPRFLLVLCAVSFLLACSSSDSNGGVDPQDVSASTQDEGLKDTTPETTPDSALDSAPDPASDTATPWPWPTCPEWAEASGMKLVEKARALDDLVRAQHLDDGLIRTLRLNEDGSVRAREHLPSSGLWTAAYLASQAFRHAVTGEEAALEGARIAAAGLHDLSAVTGIPGLYGRAYHRPDFSYNGDVSGAVHWVESTAPGYEGWWFNDDVSKDTMDGIMFGYGVALDLLDDPEVVDTVRADAIAFAQRLVDDRLNIIDHNGVVTEHGRMFYSALDDFPGFNALLVLSWLRIAVEAGGGEELRHFYDACLLRLEDRSECPETERPGADFGSYLDAVEGALGLYIGDCKTNWDHYDMIFHAIYPLLRMEDREELSQRLLSLLENGVWQPDDPAIAPPLHTSTHSLYILLYGGLRQPDASDEIFRAAVNDSVCTLFRLPLERRDLGAKAGSQETACLNRHGRPNAAEITPIEERDYDNYIWRLDPYEITQDRNPVPDRLHSPEDFLLAYWVGRYFGYISEDL
jgi:hypothetical protein